MWLYTPEVNEPNLTVRKTGYLLRSFLIDGNKDEEIIETRKNPPPNERWVHRLFVLRNETLICFEESAPHKIEENIVNTTVLPLNSCFFSKERVIHPNTPIF